VNASGSEGDMAALHRHSGAAHDSGAARHSGAAHNSGAATATAAKRCVNLAGLRLDGESQRRMDSYDRGTIIVSSFGNVYTERVSANDYSKTTPGRRGQYEVNSVTTVKQLARPVRASDRATH
jgi:hypothetical protein